MKGFGSSTERGLLRQIHDLIAREPPASDHRSVDYRYLPGLLVESVDSEDWTSLTFVGQTHRFVLRSTVGDDAALVGAQVGRLLAATEFTIPAVIVAEIAVTGAEMRDDGVVLTIEALTIDE